MGAHEEAFYQDFRVRRTVSGQRQRGCVDLHWAWHDLRWRCNAMTGHLLQFENVEISATATHRADRSGGLHLSSSIGEAAHSSRCTLQTFFPHSSTPVTPRYSRPHPISWTIPWLPTLHLPLSRRFAFHLIFSVPAPALSRPNHTWQSRHMPPCRTS